jgi:hypothetical protein
MSPDVQHRLADYARLFEALTPEGLDVLGERFAPDARFKDPFNDVQGVDAIRRVFEHMFRSCHDPRFVVHDFAGHASVGYLHWDFQAGVGPVSRPKRLFIQGVSRVTFDADGRVTSHIDYWDAGEYFYEALPLIGSLLRAIKARLRV